MKCDAPPSLGTRDGHLGGDFASAGSTLLQGSPPATRQDALFPPIPWCLAGSIVRTTRAARGRPIFSPGMPSIGPPHLRPVRERNVRVSRRRVGGQEKSHPERSRLWSPKCRLALGSHVPLPSRKKTRRSARLLGTGGRQRGIFQLLQPVVPASCSASFRQTRQSRTEGPTSLALQLEATTRPPAGYGEVRGSAS